MRTAQAMSESPVQLNQSSNVDFPPRPTKPDEVDLVVSAFAAVTNDRKAVYLSAPITTGRRFVDAAIAARSIELEPNQHRRLVIEPNRRHVRALVRRLRFRFGVVIDPTSLADVDEWTQADYRVFWGRVIELYASRVVFADGWELSNGCAYEYVTALRTGARTLTERLRPLTPAQAARQLKAAGSCLESAGLPASFLDAARKEVERLGRR